MDAKRLRQEAQNMRVQAEELWRDEKHRLQEADDLDGQEGRENDAQNARNEAERLDREAKDLEDRAYRLEQEAHRNETQANDLRRKQQDLKRQFENDWNNLEKQIFDLLGQ